MFTFRSAALSDIGRVRRENEDRALHDPELGLFGVADGVGGLPGGAEAAQYTVEQITEGVRGSPDSTPDLVTITQHVSFGVQRLGSQLSPTFGIGSTLTFGHVTAKDIIRIAHVGDSRCYVFNGRELLQLTEDHSVENEARLRRARGEVVSYPESSRAALTRCIGQPTPPAVDLIERPLRKGDRYLFCTDGICRVVRDAELAAFLSHKLDPDEILAEIVDVALQRGGPDNATGVLLMVD